MQKDGSILPRERERKKERERERDRVRDRMCVRESKR